MSQDDLFGAPAGWYPDPLGLPQLRWWNNHAWTEQTSAARQPIVMQDTKFAWADDEIPTRREERERERSLDDSERVVPERPTADTLRQLEPPRLFSDSEIPSASATASSQSAAPSQVTPQASVPTATAPVEASTMAPSVAPDVAPEVEAEKTLYQPDPIIEIPMSATPVTSLPPVSESLDALFGQRAGSQASTRLKTPIVTADALAPTLTKKVGQANNGPAWVIAMIPLFQLVLSLLLMNFGLGGVPAIFIGILAVPYFIVIALAAADQRSLTKAGYERPASWRWALLSAPVYLLMRARAVIAASGHGIGPVLAWFGLATLHIASVLAIPGLIISIAPSVFVPQVEQSVARDAQLISGSDIKVACTAALPVLIGQQTTCQSTAPSGSTSTVTVELIRSNGWIAWQVTDWGSVTMAQ